jgi:uncharacterized damage-inducible protein DinB
VDHPLDLAPAADEYAEYYGRYVSRVPRGDFLALLRSQADEVASVFGALTPAQADFAYASGKWSLKEVLGHLTDTERVFAYRALSVGRGDPSSLPGMEQDDWMATADFGRRAIGDLLAEWRAVRAATIALAEGFPPDAPLRRGVASGKGFSARALLHVAPGHTAYHLEVVRERYFGAAAWPG